MLFLSQVEALVLIEVVVGAHGPQLEDGLGPLDAPPGAGYIHAVSNQISARAFDNTPR